mmetsp:Transcript_33163/g.84714  ORF Transcript_33163/g.84714 Transcript_33163/m.84714 type:complete len:210 (-) Transcript_33163:148-777(-)
MVRHPAACERPQRQRHRKHQPRPRHHHRCQRPRHCVGRQVDDVPEDGGGGGGRGARRRRHRGRGPLRHRGAAARGHSRLEPRLPRQDCAELCGAPPPGRHRHAGGRVLVACVRRPQPSHHQDRRGAPAGQAARARPPHHRGGGHLLHPGGVRRHCGRLSRVPDPPRLPGHCRVPAGNPARRGAHGQGARLGRVAQAERGQEGGGTAQDV